MMNFNMKILNCSQAILRALIYYSVSLILAVTGTTKILNIFILVSSENVTLLLRH